MNRKTGSKVIVSNDLIRAVQKLTLTEKRLLMLAVTKIDKKAGIEQAITITADEFSHFYSLKKKGVYQSLQRAESKLWERELLMLHTDPPMVLRWVISRAYAPGKGEVYLRFHPDLEGHIFDLKKRFTQYLLSRAADFKHLYSWRLFELLMQFKTTGVLQISVDQFKDIMEIPEAYNKDFGIIRRKVINMAIKEIKEKDGLDITLSVKKRGRKITGLIFTFPPEKPVKAQRTSESGSKQSLKLDKAYIEQHASPGESWEAAQRRLSTAFR